LGVPGSSPAAGAFYFILFYLFLFFLFIILGKNIAAAYVAERPLFLDAFLKLKIHGL
jgi:hypothetical protein